MSGKPKQWRIVGTWPNGRRNINPINFQSKEMAERTAAMSQIVMPPGLTLTFTDDESYAEYVVAYGMQKDGKWTLSIQAYDDVKNIWDEFVCPEVFDSEKAVQRAGEKIAHDLHRKGLGSAPIRIGRA